MGSPAWMAAQGLPSKKTVYWYNDWERHLFLSNALNSAKDAKAYKEMEKDGPIKGTTLKRPALSQCQHQAKKLKKKKLQDQFPLGI